VSPRQRDIRDIPEDIAIFANIRDIRRADVARISTSCRHIRDIATDQQS
jgi:hypothetical protein